MTGGNLCNQNQRPRRQELVNTCDCETFSHVHHYSLGPTHEANRKLDSKIKYVELPIKSLEFLQLYFNKESVCKCHVYVCQLNLEGVAPHPSLSA